MPLAAHLCHQADQLGLRRTEENNTLDISVDEMVVVVLLEDPCSRVAQDAISFLVGEST